MFGAFFWPSFPRWHTTRTFLQANGLLSAACERQPWAPEFLAEFEKTFKMIDSLHNPPFYVSGFLIDQLSAQVISQFFAQWLIMTKDILCSLLPVLDNGSTKRVLSPSIAEAHQVVRQLCESCTVCC